MNIEELDGERPHDVRFLSETRISPLPEIASYNLEPRDQRSTATTTPTNTGPHGPDTFFGD
jgi:hypothetical protein